MSEPLRLLDVLSNQVDSQEIVSFLLEALANAEQADWEDILDGFSIDTWQTLEILRKEPYVARRSLFHLTGAKVHLEVVGLAGLICNIVVESSLSIREFKERVHRESGIVPSDQKLCLAGIVLRDDSYLCDYITDLCDATVMLVRVWSDFQLEYNGRISEGGDILEEVMTVDEAKAKAMLLPDCVGFCFEGKISDASVKVYFKNKFNNIVAYGRTWTSFRTMRSCDAAELRKHGVRISQFPSFYKDQFSAVELRIAGYRAKELKEGGWPMSEILEADYEAVALRDLGCTAASLKQAGYSLARLVYAGYAVKEFRDLGYLIGELWGPLLTKLRSRRAVVVALRDAGYTAEELVQIDCTPLDLIHAGYKSTDLKRAGFAPDKLIEVGYTPSHLKQLGCSAGDIVRIGFTTAHLREVGLVAEANRIDALLQSRP